MKTMSKTLLSLVLCAFAAAAWGQPVVDLDKLVPECESCHGPGGKSATDGIPSLAGQDADALIEMMMEFRFYERHCPEVDPPHGGEEASTMSMCDVTGRLNKYEMEALAKHFSGQ
jgi:cytochrome c553